MKKSTFLIIILVLSVSPCFAATYYVSPTGSGTTCSSVSPCLLSYANAHAVAGDTVILKDGTYSNVGINPSNTGTGSGTGRIIYQAQNNKAAVIAGGTTRYVAGINIDGKSWIKVDGVTVKDPTYYLFFIRNSSHHNEITNSEFYNSTGVDNYWGYIGGMCAGGSSFTCHSTHNWFHNNIIHDVKANDGQCLEGPNIMQIGSASSGDQESNYNTLENNIIYHGSHATLETFSKYLVLRNNVVHNDGFKTWAAGCFEDADSEGHYPGNHKYGHRNWGIDSEPRNGTTFSWILLEGNRIGYASANPVNNGAENINLSTVGVLLRYNAIYGADGNAIYFKNGIANYSRLYNNTLYANGQWNGAYGTIDRTTVSLTLGCHDNVFKNNILYGNGSGDFNCHGSGCNVYTQMDVVNNWCTTLDGTRCTKNGDPKFVSTPTVNDTVIASLTLPDLHLQSGSGAINAGTYLTMASNSGSSSTSLVVSDALYFQDGTWGSDLTRIAGTMQADWIAIGTVNNVVQISSINYSTKTITLASPKTWSNGAHIWLYKKSDGTQVLYGTAPDMGAYGYGTGNTASAAVTSNSSPGSGGGGGCFIATAAYGSYFDPHVKTLRDFRDGVLSINTPGQAFVEWYYRASPPVADYISGSDFLKACVRLMLFPAVGFCALSLKMGVIPTLVLFIMIIRLTFVVMRRVYFRRKVI